MKYKPINLKDKYEKFTEHWSPKVIAQLNNYQLKLVKIQDEFVWHCHEDTDEVFFVVEGEMGIEFRDGKLNLKAGELFVIPKGVEHKPYALEECKIMLIEPSGVVNTGDADSERFSENDVWI